MTKYLVLISVSVVVAELTLQVASATSVAFYRVLAPPWEVYKTAIPDARLMWRGNPLNPEIDAAGYRNPRRLTKADIVVLGDSQAYGPSDPGLAWPRLISLEMHQSVYNMAFPGYGPGQSLLQLDEALSLNPRVVIVAPYFGNDFFDAYALSGRRPELADSFPQSLREAAASRERQRPLEAEAQGLFETALQTTEPTPNIFHRFISDHLKLYGLFRAVNYRLTQPKTTSRQFRRAADTLAPAARQIAWPFDGGEWRTILTPRYRGRVLDDRDPRIRLGFEIARRCVRLISDRCRASGVALLVVLTPTKESVFWPRVSDPDRFPGLRELVSDEERLKEEWITELHAADVKYVDLVVPLRAASAQPYYEDADGHANETGHRTIAAAVSARLTDLPIR